MVALTTFDSSELVDGFAAKVDDVPKSKPAVLEFQGVAFLQVAMPYGGRIGGAATQRPQMNAKRNLITCIVIFIENSLDVVNLVGLEKISFVGASTSMHTNIQELYSIDYKV